MQNHAVGIQYTPCCALIGFLYLCLPDFSWLQVTRDIQVDKKKYEYGVLFLCIDRDVDLIYFHRCHNLACMLVNSLFNILWY